MSLLSEVLSGYAARIRKENALQLKRAIELRPSQVAMEISVVLNDIDTKLDADPKLKSKFDAVLARLNAPEPTSP